MLKFGSSRQILDICRDAKSYKTSLSHNQLIRVPFNFDVRVIKDERIQPSSETQG